VFLGYKETHFSYKKIFFIFQMKFVLRGVS